MNHISCKVPTFHFSIPHTSSFLGLNVLVPCLVSERDCDSTNFTYAVDEISLLKLRFAEFIVHFAFMVRLLL